MARGPHAALESFAAHDIYQIFTKKKLFLRRWLSRGKCLKRFYELRHEIYLFMNDKQKPVLELSNDEWLLDLCFLVDIVEKLNQLNISLQGKDNLIIDSCNYINAFKKKLLLFEFQLKNNNVNTFHC